MDHVETERKYDVPEETGVLTVGQPFTLGNSRTIHLAAEYVDTHEHALLAAGYSLRRRTGGDDEGWHLKFPRVGDSRREVQAPLAAGRSAALVPRALRAEIDHVVGLEALLPVARLDTERTERDVLRGGVVVARLADDRVRASRAGPAPTPEVRWREAEVELADAVDPGTLDSLEEQLHALGLVRSHSSSKIARALESLRAGRGAQGARGKDGGPARATAGDVVLAHLRSEVGALQGLEAAIQRDEPDAVHRSRVATRRLRSTLRTYGRLFHRHVTELVREELAWLGDLLGAPRDAEVLVARLLEDLDRLQEQDEDLVVGPVRERLASRLGAEHRAAHDVLVHALGSERHHRLMESLVALLVDPPLRRRAARKASEVLPAIAQRAERRVDQARGRVRQQPDETARLPLLHDVRKKAKAARYAYDVLLPVFGDEAREASERWERVTDELGEFQDTVVMTARLRDLAEAAEAADEPSFTYGLLLERAHERGRAALAAAQESLDAAPGGLGD